MFYLFYCQNQKEKGLGFLCLVMGIVSLSNISVLRTVQELVYVEASLRISYLCVHLVIIVYRIPFRHLSFPLFIMVADIFPFKSINKRPTELNV